MLDESELNTEIVHIGSRVRVKNLDTGEEETYHIVGSTEANPLMGRISNESPVGREMLTRTKGDVFEVEVPDGIIKYEILEIMK